MPSSTLTTSHSSTAGMLTLLPLAEWHTVALFDISDGESINLQHIGPYPKPIKINRTPSIDFNTLWIRPIIFAYRSIPLSGVHSQDNAPFCMFCSLHDCCGRDLASYTGEWGTASYNAAFPPKLLFIWFCSTLH